MGKSYLDLVNECDRFPYYEDNPAVYLEHLKNYHIFKVAGCDAALGYILNSTVEKFFSLSDCWSIDTANRTVTLVAPADATPEQRSQLVAKSLDKAVELGTFDILKGWRNEMYPVYGPGGEFLLEMERSATPLFGVVSYGVHSTCYVDDADGLRIWVPRRSRTKQTYPGMLDNSVAGGMSTTEHPFECLVREAMEEASLPEDVVRANATAAGCVTYTYVRSSKAGGETDMVQPEVEYVFDIKVGADIVPKPCDTEVEEFNLYTVEETKAAMANGEFKPNCAVVLIDFFIRHGIITPENEPDYLEIVARVHRRFEFPTASHVMK
ncbi:thiamine pyrophosphokinase-related protein [Aspergillus sclerotioniger CBS 115572]|uniref:Thiamine pyrophosphokinase-related protein n=1 Tax=Aspergillus sclerotioniger CBS 115572 TaxID=1450535 RepID=A0A317XHH3_9EURO|nr:thiamine pyrophosphokinase-related protein [Aspergillus sclerotioniger CBS 115572]PWY96620.1 thiamine pyrophosphokinase-related protein [Aspergillus sclerotioniger CBS 115572]